MRLIPTLKSLLVLGLALRLHHHFHGSPIDYSTVAVAAAASWIGVPGPGEPVLIAAGVLAAKHKLDITTVVVVAFLAAMMGGVAGWLIGKKFGRAAMTLPGPLYRMRIGTLKRGDEIFGRFPVFAILMTPSVIAGIHRIRTSVYLITNGVGSFAWAAGIGLGAYWAGPAVVDLVNDVGLITGIGLGILIVAGVVFEIQRRQRHRRHEEATAADLPTKTGGTAPPDPRRSAG